MTSDGATSEEESPQEFSASEDDWNPDEARGGSRESLRRKSTGGRRHKPVAKGPPPRPTRTSRRIANRLGQDVPNDEPEVVVVDLPEEESSSSEEEGGKRNLKKRRVSAKKPGRKPKQLKNEPIKLTTFTVEELYRKYRPDLAAGPSKQKEVKGFGKARVKKEDDDDESSGDDYLVDPAELDLNSEFFSVDAAISMKKSENVEFDCNAGLSAVEDDNDEDEGADNIPLSCVKDEEASTLEFNKKLIQQINQSSRDCMNLVKLAEVSKRMENDRIKMERLQKERKVVHKQEEDVSNLLIAGEKIPGKLVKKSSRSDFVAVVTDEKHKKPKEKSVEITIKFDTAEQGKQPKKKIDLITAIKRLINREKRQNQIYLHKVSILCWIGHGTYLHKVLSDPALQATTTKRLLPSADCRPKGLTNLQYFSQLLRYFRKVVKLKNHSMYFQSTSKLPPLASTLKYQILQRSAFSRRDYILLFLLMLRSLSIHSRLIISLPVPPKHVPTSELYRMNPQESDRRLLAEFRRTTASAKGSTIARVKEKINVLTQKNSEQTRREAARKRRREGFCSTSIPQLDGGSDLVEKVPRKKLKLMEGSFLDIERNVVPKQTKKDDEQGFPEELDDSVRRRREKILAAYRASKEQKELARARREEAEQRRLCGSCRSKKRKSDRRNRLGIDLWLEVYCEHEDKWVTVDVAAGKLHCLEDIVKSASEPISYVLAWNNDGTIKDVSPRYISRLGTKKSKLRVDDAWLAETLRGYSRRRPSRRDRTEDLKFDKLLNKRPFPEQIGEYKNHPRFAIKRHLLRNEAIYPPDADVLGHIRGEPIYPRDCVHVLLAREGWLRQAKTVKLFEEPYKVVKRKAKYDRATGTTVTGLNTELFGEWQVQDYEPPEARDGVVPRSAYGNVDLFKPCMLPKGTVHLQLPGLNKICKRLRVDCASAITGFEWKNNSCQAVYDGYVVCAEFRDQVIDEWYQEQVELERKQDERREKRIYGNWKRLITGLFIRKKLKDRYNFDNM